jgi:hypothetical protein
MTFPAFPTLTIYEARNHQYSSIHLLDIKTKNQTDSKGLVSETSTMIRAASKNSHRRSQQGSYVVYAPCIC